MNTFREHPEKIREHSEKTHRTHVERSYLRSAQFLYESYQINIMRFKTIKFGGYLHTNNSDVINLKFSDIICGGSDQLGKNITPNIAENGQKGRKKGGQCGQIWGSLYEMMRLVRARGPLLTTAVICLLLCSRIRAYFVCFPRF